MYIGCNKCRGLRLMSVDNLKLDSGGLIYHEQGSYRTRHLNQYARPSIFGTQKLQNQITARHSTFRQVLCRIVPSDSIPAENIPVGPFVCGSLRYDVVNNLDGGLNFLLSFFSWHVLNTEYLIYNDFLICQDTIDKISIWYVT